MGSNVALITGRGALLQIRMFVLSAGFLLSATQL